MKVLVTGVGSNRSHICELLLQRGDEVVVVDNLETGRKEHLHPQKISIHFETISDREGFLDNGKYSS